jgi:UDP-glucose 4-epimerase
MNILVTGGAGYIGSVVTEELTKAGHIAVVYDNLSYGHREAVQAPAKLIEGDLLDGDTLRRVLREHSIEAVMHMAAFALVGESVTHPAKYYQNNLGGGLSLLNAMKDCGVKQLVFSSTCATYGEPERVPIDESFPNHPTNPYGESKLAFERALRWYSAAYGLQYASLRYFNAAGATKRCGEMHDPETHLIPLVLQVAAGVRAEVQIFGDDYPTRDGTCVRDYIHIVDLAAAHILALAILGERSAIYNLGCGGNGYTVKEVIDVAREVTGRTIATRLAPRRAGDPAVLVAASDKIRRELGWQPNFQDLRLIIQSAWDWLVAHPRGYEQ